MRSIICQMVPMSDGVHLATDIWLPDGGGRHPVVFMRTPYSRAGMMAVPLPLRPVMTFVHDEELAHAKSQPGTLGDQFLDVFVQAIDLPPNLFQVR